MRRPIAWLALACLAASDAPAQAPPADDLARCKAAATANAPGVLLVGDPSRGQGTAFVISREHRLAATAAHVADLYRGPGSIVAVINGSIVGYRVSRVWYHPSLRRSLDAGLTVLSPDPVDGAVSVPGPDVAVIELEPGPDLPHEWTLAGPDEARRLDHRAVALLGYPGYGDWPTAERPAVATLHAGVIRGHDGYSFFEGGHPGRRQLLEHSAATPEGSSGSPVFLPTGSVVGVHNILRLDEPDGSAQSGMSVRVDALWELLRYHRLDAMIPPASRPWDVLVPVASQVDPRRDDLRRAVALVREAEALSARRDYRGAGERCNEAVRLAPEYPAAYVERGRSYAGYVGHAWSTLPAAEKRKHAEWAVADAKTGFLLAPEKLDGLCLLIQNTLYLGLLDHDPAAYREVIDGADEILSRRHVNARDRSFLTNCRAQARHYLGDWDGALRDYSDSIRLAPSEPVWYVNRAQYWDQRGRPDQAEADRRAAASLSSRR